MAKGKQGWRGPLPPGKSFKSMGLNPEKAKASAMGTPASQLSSPVDDADSTPVKRGRGRPPKAKLANNTAIESASISELEPPDEAIKDPVKDDNVRTLPSGVHHETRSFAAQAPEQENSEVFALKKRGRGRPKKQISSPGNVLNAVVLNNSPDFTPVNPRSRPPITTTSTKPAAIEAPVKRGRGRPRKRESGVVPAGSEASDEAEGLMALTPARTKKGTARPLSPEKKAANLAAKQLAQQEEAQRQISERKVRKQAREEKNAAVRGSDEPSSPTGQHAMNVSKSASSEQAPEASSSKVPLKLDSSSSPKATLKRMRAISQSEKDTSALFGQNARLKKQRQREQSRSTPPLSAPKAPTKAAGLVMRTASTSVGASSRGKSGSPSRRRGQPGHGDQGRDQVLEPTKKVSRAKKDPELEPDGCSDLVSETAGEEADVEDATTDKDDSRSKDDAAVGADQ